MQSTNKKCRTFFNIHQKDVVKYNISLTTKLLCSHVAMIPVSLNNLNNHFRKFEVINSILEKKSTHQPNKLPLRLITADVKRFLRRVNTGKRWASLYLKTVLTNSPEIVQYSVP